MHLAAYGGGDTGGAEVRGGIARSGSGGFHRFSILQFLAFSLLVGCADRAEPDREIVKLEFLGPPVELRLGVSIRVDGLISEDPEGSFALFTRTGAGDYSEWDCVILQDVSWWQKAFFPSATPENAADRSYQATGIITARGGTFGRGDGFRHGPRQCLFTMEVERINRLELSPELVNRIQNETYSAGSTG